MDDFIELPEDITEEELRILRGIAEKHQKRLEAEERKERERQEIRKLMNVNKGAL